MALLAFQQQSLSNAEAAQLPSNKTKDEAKLKPSKILATQGQKIPGPKTDGVSISSSGKEQPNEGAIVHSSKSKPSLQELSKTPGTLHTADVDSTKKSAQNKKEAAEGTSGRQEARSIPGPSVRKKESSAGAAGPATAGEGLEKPLSKRPPLEARSMFTQVETQLFSYEQFLRIPTACSKTVCNLVMTSSLRN